MGAANEWLIRELNLNPYEKGTKEHADYEADACEYAALTDDWVLQQHLIDAENEVPF